MSKHGPPLGTWTITGMQVSRVDPTYVLFRVSPAQGHEADVQGGYGFAHNGNGKWTVTGYGTSEVGCPPGAPDNTPVPAPVIVGFSLTCPPERDSQPARRLRSRKRSISAAHCRPKSGAASKACG